MRLIDSKRRTHLQLVKPAAPDYQPLDVSSLLDRIEVGLRALGSSEQTRALSLLSSWAWNDMIKEGCQARARHLLIEFAARH